MRLRGEERRDRLRPIEDKIPSFPDVARYDSWRMARVQIVAKCDNGVIARPLASTVSHAGVGRAIHASRREHAGRDLTPEVFRRKDSAFPYLPIHGFISSVCFTLSRIR